MANRAPDDAARNRAADLIPEIKHATSIKLNIVHLVSFVVGIALLLGVRFLFED